jgi:hypothetical protein
MVTANFSSLRGNITCLLRTLSSMTLKPLEILKKGLAKLSQKTKTKRDELKAKLSRNDTISSADEQWLDHDGNLVDEQRVLDRLESASDYDRGIEWLDVNEKAIVTKLREWAADLAKIAGNKRKHMNL